MSVRRWRDQALCRHLPPALFDADVMTHPLEHRSVRLFCDQCPVRGMCLEVALAAEAGGAAVTRGMFYAGLDPKERAALARQRKVAA